MKLKKKLFKYRTGLLMTAGCIIIMVITLFFVGEKNVPYVLGDEFGYWTSAAYFFGYDWSGIASINEMCIRDRFKIPCYNGAVIWI